MTSNPWTVRCDRCGGRASVRIAGENACWPHYNDLLRETGEKGKVIK